MNRRRALKQMGSAALVLAWPTTVGSRRVVRRRRPRDAGWPSRSAWNQLADKVDGNLLKVASPLSRCRGQTATNDCAEVFRNLHNPYYIRDEPGLTQTLGWVDAWVAEPSVYAVAARTAEHVAAAVNFAREHNLRLVIKGGGHSYQGTSSAPDSLLLWTRYLDEVAIDEQFVPRGCSCSPEAVVSLGAGAIWMQAYDAVTTRRGRYVQGGGCTTVGVAGLVQSGGFGSFSKRYGLAAAGLVEAEVITADGRILTVNSAANTDLFWALKGGGGGTFGAISRLTLRVRDLPASFGAVVVRIRAASDADFRRLIGSFIAFYREALFNPHWGEQARFAPANTLAIEMVCAGLTGEDIQRTWKAFLDSVARAPKAYRLELAPFMGAVPARQWWNPPFMRARAPGIFASDPRPGADPTTVWWASDSDQVGQVLHGYESVWLPERLLEGGSQQQLARALFDASRHWNVSLHFNKGLAGAFPGTVSAAQETAINPEALTAFALAISGAGGAAAYPGAAGHEPDRVAARRGARQTRRCIDELRAVAGHGGSYVAESNYFERAWQDAHWGRHYPRLADIKKKYDPDNLFWVHHGVGSEGWSADGFEKL